MALYIINIKIRLTSKKTINAYINLKLTTTTKSQVETQLKNKIKSEEANWYFDIKAFHTLK